MPAPLLKLESVAKAFAGVQALKPLQLELVAGEILGLIGENGAGKSTLIKVLSGVHSSDSGTIVWEGRAVQFDSPRDALETGIATIHQELAYFGHLSVAENLLMGDRWPRYGWGGVNWGKLFSEAEAQLARFDLEISPHASFQTLTAAQRQEVAIARALSRRARLLILDEPTASLTEPEVKRLLVQLNRLREAGVAMLYVSHRLDEILQLTDRVAVLRDGELVATYRTADSNLDQLVRDMVGRALEQVYPRTRRTQSGRESSPAPHEERVGSGPRRGGTNKNSPPPHEPSVGRADLQVRHTNVGFEGAMRECNSENSLPSPLLHPMDARENSRNLMRPWHADAPLLELNCVSCADMFHEVSFTVNAGEIVGLAGLVGAGRSELGRAIYGLYPVDSGTMRLCGKPWKPASAREAVLSDLVYLPEERKRQGLVLDHSVNDSISIGFSDLIAPLGLIDRRKEANRVEAAMQRHSIRARNSAQEVGTLSGGNQQKALLARWLEREPTVIILDEPTRGVDVAAKAEIHGLIDRLAGQGKAVLLISSDLAEVLGMSDRVLVMHRGRISAELQGEALTQANVILAASGLGSDTPQSGRKSGP